MNIITILIIILLFSIFVTWLDNMGWKHKKESVTGQSEAGPWYLVVYTQDSNYPIWISNNNICSVHPDPEHCNIIVKQFNGEDMVIENVISYDMRTANKMFDYEM